MKSGLSTSKVTCRESSRKLNDNAVQWTGHGCYWIPIMLVYSHGDVCVYLSCSDKPCMHMVISTGCLHIMSWALQAQCRCAQIRWCHQQGIYQGQLTLVVSMSCCQCRGRMAGLRKSATNGIDTRKFLTMLSRPLNTSSSRTCAQDRAATSSACILEEKHTPHYTGRQ